MNIRTLTGAESTRAVLPKVLLQSGIIIVSGLALAIVLGGLLLATRK
jgi:hypothetical protein